MYLCDYKKKVKNIRYKLVLIRDVYPGSNNSTKRGGGNIFLSCHFCIHKYHKIVNNFIFEQIKKFFLAKTLRITVLFTQTFVIKLSKIWVWRSGSEIRDPESNKAPDPGSATLIQKS
jgi:hypothetical protein